MTDAPQPSRAQQFVGDLAPKLAELPEAITHLAFYAGRPKAMPAIPVARQVFGEAE